MIIIIFFNFLQDKNNDSICLQKKKYTFFAHNINKLTETKDNWKK